MHLLLADDHSMVRDALKTLIERLIPDAVVYLANTFDEAFVLAEQQPILDLVILDLKMPGMNRLEGLTRMRTRFPTVPVAIMSGAASQDEIREAMDQGAYGYFPKTLSGAALVTAIHLVLAGEKFVPVDALRAEPVQPEDDVTLGQLTQRERQVLSYLEKGWSNKEIARALDLQEVTIKLHVRGLCRKLGAKNRTQAALIGQEGHR